MLLFEQQDHGIDVPNLTVGAFLTMDSRLKQNTVDANAQHTNPNQSPSLRLCPCPSHPRIIQQSLHPRGYRCNYEVTAGARPSACRRSPSSIICNSSCTTGIQNLHAPQAHKGAMTMKQTKIPTPAFMAARIIQNQIGRFTGLWSAELFMSVIEISTYRSRLGKYLGAQLKSSKRLRAVSRIVSKN